MNAELANALQILIQKSIVTFEKTGDFLSEEIPQVIQQLLLWNFTLHLILCIFGISLLVGWIFLEQKAWKYTKEQEKTLRNYDAGAATFTYLAVGSFFRIPFALFLYYELLNLTWLKILIAPKYYLVEQAMHLFK